MKKFYLKSALVTLAVLTAAVIAYLKPEAAFLEEGALPFNKKGERSRLQDSTSASSEDEESKPTKFWLNMPNNADSYGVNFDETEARSFLNESQVILAKAIKSHEDRAALEALMGHDEHFLTIESHYSDLPREFYFVEEASRVKMLNFLIGNLEISAGEHTRSIDSIHRILEIPIKSIAHEGLAKSIAGDQIRLLAALHKYCPKAYEALAAELKEEDVNTKIFSYFEESLVLKN